MKYYRLPEEVLKELLIALGYGLYINIDFHNPAMVAAIEILEGPGDGWASVDPLTPQDDFHVIGCCDDDVFECCHQGDGVFNDLVGKGVDVTHWMPLPEPFKEDKA